MNSNQSPRDVGVVPAQAKRSHILMATVDTLPEPYRILGLVEATVTVPSYVAPTGHLLDILESEAVGMGADGVLGIRMTQITLAGASRARFVGRVTDHVEHTVVATALGTAVRRLASGGRDAGHRHYARCSR